jgi:hypothetical protein
MDQQTIFDSLKDKGPEAWLRHLQRFEEGEPISGLSTQVIFHHVAPMAKKLGSLEWAEVAVRAAELEARNGRGIDREEALLNAMNLRSWFIVRKGSRPGHLVLDTGIILSWVMDGLTLPMATAGEKGMALWENLARAKASPDSEAIRSVTKDLHDLRWIKHRLNVVKVLVSCGELPETSETSVLNEWLKILESLP